MKPELSKLPHKSGCYLYLCYLYLDGDKKVIYVGKAKDLHKRVASYFSKKAHDAKTEVMLSQAESIDFIVTNTEVEALILENNLIKKNSPIFASEKKT